MKKSGLITLGEALIDFIPLDKTNTSYQKSPGGAPANVAVGAARLGMKSTFIGKLGNDVLGEFLRTTLKGFGVDVSSIRLTSDYRTGLVFVTLASDGERSFSFYIDPSADMFLDETEIEENVFKENKVFHFGTISLLMDPVRSATKKAISYAKKHGMIVSFDPNVRLSLWKDEALLKETIFNMLPDVDVLKISTEELDFLTGSEDTAIIDNWMTKYGLSLIFLTKGAEGSTVFTKSGAVEVKALKVNTIDTTGAGDAFVSGFLYCLNEREQDLSTISVEEAAEIAAFASVSGALAAAQKGAMTALPTLPEVQKMLSEDGSRS
ncbi:aminoimidazole riboside kinase [Mesobacillus harenae]|uniref:aminoimidazole riboside kinase n=1 Tax=Mesobacillus harenae TaxID=2213203 RepID=UPI0015802976|nr:aminoimidazole riboside kinase [Mesobacillus harenae]